MEKQRDWAQKLVPTAHIASRSYQDLIHDMPLTFDPENIRELQQTNILYIQGITIQKAAWLKNLKIPGKLSGSLILWLKSAEQARYVIMKGMILKSQQKAAEIFRSGFRIMQCFNCQRYGNIAKACTVIARCGACAEEYNSRECSGKNEIRCCECGRKNRAWEPSYLVRIAAKAKTVVNRTQDPGRYRLPESIQRDTEREWQIVGSRKRRASTTGQQVVGADSEIISRRGPERPKKNHAITPYTSTMWTEQPTPSHQNSYRPVTCENIRSNDV